MSSDSKIRILFVEKLLLQGKHEVSEIQELLELNWGITAHRTTIYEDLKTLDLFFNVKKEIKNHKHYYKLEVVK